MRMVISGAKFSSLYDGDRNLAKRRIWTCIRTTGKLPPKKPVQKKARKTKEESSGTTGKQVTSISAEALSLAWYHLSTFVSWSQLLFSHFLLQQILMVLLLCPVCDQNAQGHFLVGPYIMRQFFLKVEEKNIGFDQKRVKL